MRGLAAGVWLGWLLGVVGVAAAQELDAPSEQSADAPTPTEGVPPPGEVPPPPLGDTAPDGVAEADWGRFQAAARRALQVRGPEGRRALAALGERQDPVGRAARELLDALDHTLDAPVVPASPEALRAAEAEHDPTSAIAELAVGQGFNGGTLGIWVCLLATCQEPALFAGLSLVGVGGALTLSILLPNRDFQHGQAAAIGWGSFLGGGYGGLVLGMLAGSPLDAQGVGATLLLAQALGTAAGIGVAAGLDPPDGRVSMAAWSGLWLGALSLMGMGIANFSGLDTASIFGVVTAASTSGLLAGALLGEIYPMSRARVVLLSGMGVVGAGVGMGLTVLIANRYVGEAFWTAAMVGALTGIILTGALTDGMDASLRAPDLQVGLAPLEDGALATFSGTL